MKTYIIILLLILLFLILINYDRIENYTNIKTIGLIVASPVDLPPQGTEAIMRGRTKGKK